ncbi:Zinc finger protein [Gossypium arboreum]|uniref:Zinc finger protein n=1 Tax=Gossypium arboreum TaxID=29729 RepID=A0A0B0NHU0_GOSAR|nr:Zinc finger protein [Gossypium arboreum]
MFKLSTARLYRRSKALQWYGERGSKCKDVGRAIRESRGRVWGVRWWLLMAAAQGK